MSRVVAIRRWLRSGCVRLGAGVGEEDRANDERVVEGVQQPGVGQVLPRAQVGERKGQGQGNVGGDILPPVAVHEGKEQARYGRDEPRGGRRR